MPQMSSLDPTLVGKAVAKLRKHPTLTVSEAMQLAGFPEVQFKCWSSQKTVSRALSGKKKGGIMDSTVDLASSRQATINETSTNIEISTAGEIILSPLTAASMLSTAPVSNGPPAQKKKQLTSKQVQDKWTEDFKMKEHFKASHKAATLLYDQERKKKME